METISLSKKPPYSLIPRWILRSWMINHCNGALDSPYLGQFTAHGNGACNQRVWRDGNMNDVVPPQQRRAEKWSNVTAASSCSWQETSRMGAAHAWSNDGCIGFPQEIGLGLHPILETSRRNSVGLELLIYVILKFMGCNNDNHYT